MTIDSAQNIGNSGCAPPGSGVWRSSGDDSEQKNYRGFAAMDPDEQRRIARMGGLAYHEKRGATGHDHR